MKTSNQQQTGEVTAAGGRLQWIRLQAGRINVWLPALLAFALPLSTSALSVLAIAILLLWLIEGNFREKFREIFSNTVVLAVLAFLAVLILGLLWSPDVGAGLEVIRARWKIALLPVFLTAISLEKRSLYCNFFLAGLTAAMCLTFLAWFDLIHFGGLSPEHLTRKTSHIIYNPLLAFGIYLVLHEAVWGGRKAVVRSALFILAGVMIFNMFITEGRAGQLAFFVLMVLFLFQLFKRNRLKAVLAICLLLPALFAAGYFFSPVFQERVDVACKEISQFHDNPDTSVGLRLLFWGNSCDMIRRHPWIGVGTGGFQISYAWTNWARTPWHIATDNPHNQYLLVAATVGIPGAVIMLLIFVAMFRQAWLMRDKWQRVRFAFPLFFLTIMLTESYLKVYETAFLFALFSAVLYKKSSGKQVSRQLPEGRKCWLILSYRANVKGSACSQHIDDRLPCFREQGIEPVLLTGPVGEKADQWIHYRTHSLAPSGIRFELRHFLRKHLAQRWQFKLVETILLLPVFPLYLLEKIIVNLESEWSWFFLASWRGILLCRRYKPEVIYSTGGSASAHVAALLIKKWTGIKWLAETQDPLVHDHDWQRSSMVLKLYKALERLICDQADCFIFLVHAAREHTAQRVGGRCSGAVIYPGSVPSFFQPALYTKGTALHFAHFGSLAGSRNLVVFFQALQQSISQGKVARELVRVDVYGSFDSASAREMKELHLEDLVVCHGPVPRDKALAAMQQADCLLLIQNIIFFSCETIPSKVYEYLFSGRPILGLLHRNEELKSMLAANNHLVVSADDVSETAAAIQQLVDRFTATDFVSKESKTVWTVAEAVKELIVRSKRCKK